MVARFKYTKLLGYLVTMASKTIKISEENYKMLLGIIAIVQQEKGCRASFDDALDDLAERKEKKKKLSDLAGSWKMNDEEWNNIRSELKRGWKKWKIPSV